MSRVSVSVLISAYEGGSQLAALLASIDRLEDVPEDTEVIVRDDGSGDGGREALARAHPRVRWLSGAENLGFAKSYNVLLGEAQGEVLCCVNQDTVLEPGFLREGLELLRQHPDVAAVNTNMIMPWVMSPEAFDSSSPEGLPTYEYQLTSQGFVSYVPVTPQVRETNFLTGGGFFLRRSALAPGEALFDPALAAYCEDTDLALRLRAKGLRILYAPRAILFHDQAPKRGRAPAELLKLLRITWNRFYVLAKHDGPGRLLRRYPRYLWGIVHKMRYLGLPAAARWFAYLAGGVVALVFALLCPYWLLRAAVATR